MPLTRKRAHAPDPWISVKKAAKVLGIAPQTVYARAAAGVLDTLHADGRTFVSRASVARLQAAQQSEAA